MSASTEPEAVGTTDGRAASISSIAAEAGVSIPTVSKVLNGRPDVAADTRARVESVIERHRYQRRRARQSSRPALIDLVFHEMHSAWSTEIIRGVEQAAAAERAAVVLSELGGAHRPRQEWFDDLLTRRPLGVILVLAELDEGQRHQLATRNIPFVVVDTAGEQPPGVPVVGSANWAGGLAATRHLLGLGHRRIAVISGPTTMLCSRARVDGFRSALDAEGVVVEPDFVRYGNFFVDGGYAHGLALLDRPDRPTAIFAGSDFQALGVMRAARELGLSIPGDLSIVGYDDVQVTEWIGPPLTTVRQPLREMATTAAQMVFTLARGERPRNERIDLATELVVRQSTAPPKW
ncbi:LacI family DNA-binding transcriptional regulator [Saccharothrix syringae]|uniref:LacI family transcriptional regulator n=1 Tax=Saccharothrix syringae TaxID=103733 RepID=A0A5Q0GX81_SACSY|nr:LacI family DNA-binding transcriptional regulator [Saccharothrix syringae]QFZ18285.1 LacI family transcriptional regulator [Saccharothrix syringae]